MARFGDVAAIAAGISDPRDGTTLDCTPATTRRSTCHSDFGEAKDRPIRAVRLEATISLAQVCTTEQLLNKWKAGTLNGHMRDWGIARADRAGKVSSYCGHLPIRDSQAH